METKKYRQSKNGAVYAITAIELTINQIADNVDYKSIEGFNEVLFCEYYHVTSPHVYKPEEKVIDLNTPVLPEEVQYEIHKKELDILRLEERIHDIDLPRDARYWKQRNKFEEQIESLKGEIERLRNPSGTQSDVFDIDIDEFL